MRDRKVEISFLLLAGEATEDLARTLRSMLAQTEDVWECIILASGATSDTAREALGTLHTQDERIVIVDVLALSATAALNAGVDAASGTFIGIVDAGDLLSPSAVAAFARALGRSVEFDVAYSDEAVVDELGILRDRFSKPDWSPERLRGQSYMGRLSIFRRELVVEVGGFDERFLGAHEHDLALRVGERARDVVHLSDILYVRCAKGMTHVDHALDAAQERAWLVGCGAVQAHMDRLELKSEVTLGDVPGTYAIRRFLNPSTLVSVVIPTLGSAGLIWGERRCYVVEAVRSLLAHTKHEALEIVVVYDTATPSSVLQELREVAGAKLVLKEYLSPFNFSEKCNVGYLAASGDIIVMLNDDVEAHSDELLEQLAAPLEEASVGMTGARLLFPDDTIQHAGHTYARNIMDHPCMGVPNGVPGPHALLAVNREASGLTAACVAIRRDTFTRVGGFSETLPVNFNDVDFSLKIRSLGLRNVWLAGVVLYHFESRTRQRTTQPWEPAVIYSRWNIQGGDKYMPGVD